MKPTLVVLAAGIGSRYGGIKQIDPVGRHGEAILDYSIFDALRAGFGRVVFVIRRDIEDDFKAFFGNRIANRTDVGYVFQDLSDLPPGHAGYPERKKPWGTGHAVYSTRHAVSEPFAVINADDFYGKESYEVMSRFLSARGSVTGEYAMVGYILSRTMSTNGSVSRGLCEVDDTGLLLDIDEHVKISYEGDGIVSLLPDGEKLPLTGKETVSMNFFGFTPDAFSHIERLFGAFLEKSGTDPKAEFYIPIAAKALIREGTATMTVLRSNASWFGVTYREDKPDVVDRIGELIDSGKYPDPLWG